MSRYIDADKLVEYQEHAWDWDTVNGIETAIALRQVISDIRHEPTADVVEVVRCKDCKFWQTDWKTSYDGYHYCSMVDIVVDGDFYCKDGERKILPKD